jgi:hypothetical protein
MRRRTACATVLGAAAGLLHPIAAHAAGRELLAWYYLQFTGDFSADLDRSVQARIDGLIFSETGDPNLVPYLDAAAQHGQRLCLGLEPAMYSGAQDMVRRLQDLRSLTQHPAYFWTTNTTDGLPRPVIVGFAMASVPALFWQTVRGQVDPNHEMVWVGEGTTFESAPFFDAWHLYSVAWANDPVGTARTWAQRIRERGLRYAATVMPGGFYGSGNDPSQWTPRPRAGGAFYRATWSGAQAVGADLAILTSYNERAEQTDIQPLPEWGDQYLALTAALSNEWRTA